MWMCYLIALLPLVVGSAICFVSKRVTWWEWILGAAGGFILSGVFHYAAIKGMVADEEMRSGYATRVNYHPMWVEEYQVAVYKTVTRYRTVGGRREAYTEQVFSHYETRHATHPEHWNADVTYGSQQNGYGIERELHEELHKRFGAKSFRSGVQPTLHGGHRDSGDNGVYSTDNNTGYIQPAVKFTSFENRVKAAPSVFSYARVPENAPVFEYPKDMGWERSDRLKDDAKNHIPIRDWDCMNARLGPLKKVNVILVGFGSTDSSLGHLQEAKWTGGKKNDLVLCYGIGPGGKVSWTYVFGWTEEELCKRNLETILLRNPINKDIIPLIEQEIRARYIIKDWTKFDYITVELPLWAFFVLILVMTVVQGGYYLWAYRNKWSDK